MALLTVVQQSSKPTLASTTGRNNHYRRSRSRDLSSSSPSASDHRSWYDYSSSDFAQQYKDYVKDYDDDDDDDFNAYYNFPPPELYSSSEDDYEERVINALARAAANDDEGVEDDAYATDDQSDDFSLDEEDGYEFDQIRGSPPKAEKPPPSVTSKGKRKKTKKTKRRKKKGKHTTLRSKEQAEVVGDKQNGSHSQIEVDDAAEKPQEQEQQQQQQHGEVQVEKEQNEPITSFSDNKMPLSSNPSHQEVPPVPDENQSLAKWLQRLSREVSAAAKAASGARGNAEAQLAANNGPNEEKTTGNHQSLSPPNAPSTPSTITAPNEHGQIQQPPPSSSTPAAVTANRNSSPKQRSDHQTTPWVRKFLALRPKDHLLPLPRDYLSDHFNLARLSPVVEHFAMTRKTELEREIPLLNWEQKLEQRAREAKQNASTQQHNQQHQHHQHPMYRQALDLILRQADDPLVNEEPSPVVQYAAEVLYTLVHQRFAVSTRGLDALYRRMVFHMRNFDKSRTNDNRHIPYEPLFGRCPRLRCGGMPLLPCGLSDNYSTDKDKSSSNSLATSRAKRYCCNCRETFDCWDSRVDGSAWGTSVCHLLLLVYGRENLFPSPFNTPYTEAGAASDDQSKEDLLGNSGRIFGFPIHPLAKQ